MRTLGLADPAFVAATAIAPSGYDIDAAAYITAVETADGQALETAVADAINAFVVGCKADGIWDAIKASCILAGARTLAGALVPLVGVAPTNFNFVAGDYDRKTGLVGDRSTKYLSTNRLNNADPQDSNHNSVYISVLDTVQDAAFMGSSNGFGPSEPGSNVVFRGVCRNRSGSFDLVSSCNSNTLMGVSRSSNLAYQVRVNGSTATVSRSSQTSAGGNVWVFARNSSTTSYTNARLAFYSIGESLDLALLDARVTTMINAFAAAIP